MTTPKRNEAVARFVPAAYRQTGQTVVQMQPSHGVPGDHVDYVLYKDYAALQGEVSRLREAATVLRNNFRCVLSVNCNCDEEFIDRQTAEIDALLEPPTDGR